MKPYKWTTLLLSLLLITFFVSCDNEDAKSESGDIIGQWHIESIHTNNSGLDLALMLLLEKEGIELTLGTFTFEESGVVDIHLPRAGKTPVKYAPLYEYADSQVAFRFDEILPVPFNCDVPRLTDKKMRIEAFLPPELLQLALGWAEKEEPEIAATLKVLLQSNLTDGLTILLHFTR